MLAALAWAALWGGSALVGGAAVALAAAILICVVLGATGIVVGLLERYARRFAVVCHPAASSRRNALLLFAVVKLWVPLTPQVLLNVPFSPFRANAVRLYAHIPADVAARTRRWVGPMPIGPGKLGDGTFHVGLGYGYSARVEDGAHGFFVVLAFPNYQQIVWSLR